MYEIDGLSCARIARQSGQPLTLVRQYLRLAYREPDDGEPWDDERHRTYRPRRGPGSLDP